MKDLVCEHCGRVIEVEDDVVEVHSEDGTKHTWCIECAEENAHRCERCGDWYDHPLDSVGTSYGDEDWCHACVDAHAVRCYHCETYHETTTEVVTGGYWSNRTYESWCDHCVDRDAIVCDDCGEAFSNDAIYVRGEPRHGGGTIDLCESCYDENWSTCSYCGYIVSNDDVVEHRDEYYCPDCRHPSDNIEGYHHTNGSLFLFGNGKKRYRWDLSRNERRKLYLGIELEVDDCDDVNELAGDIKSEYPDEVEIKEDGSLSEDGLEIVSQPGTPRYHLTSGMWERISALVRNYGGTSHDNGSCGLHIHISRDFFNDHDAVYRLDRLFHRFERQVVRFSRRRDYQMHWCRIDDDSDLSEIKNIIERKKEWNKKKSYANRYEAVNNTNSATVEIRLWRGTLNTETLRATIEFTTGLAIVANTIGDELADTLKWSTLKLLVCYALEREGLPHGDFDSYILRRGL